jgi:hypothetical protein
MVRPNSAEPLRNRNEIVTPTQFLNELERKGNLTCSRTFLYVAQRHENNGGKENHGLTTRGGWPAANERKGKLSGQNEKSVRFHCLRSF